MKEASKTTAIDAAMDLGKNLAKDMTKGVAKEVEKATAKTAPAKAAAKGRAPGLTTEGVFECTQSAFPFGAHVAVVNIDRATGGVCVERYLASFDIGVAINPMLVKGQIAGSMVQGLGGALFEEFIYDADGQPLAVTFADYMLPTMSVVPDLEILLTEDAPSPLNPLGIKGGGESAITAVGAVIAAAIDDALATPGAVRQLPVTPQRLRTLLKAGIALPA